jgi:hypothetical protein
MLKQWCLSLALATLLAAAPVRAQDLTQPSASPAYTGLSSSPHTGGLLPSSLFDPKRFSISNSLVFGVSTGSSMYGNGGTAGLFTSSLGYKLSPNMTMRVNVGAHINPAYGSNEMAKGVFLEGASFDWRPTTNSLLRVEYRDLRSPLQNPWGYGGYAPSYGYSPLGSGFAGDPMRN